MVMKIQKSISIEYDVFERIMKVRGERNLSITINDLLKAQLDAIDELKKKE